MQESCYSKQENGETGTKFKAVKFLEAEFLLGILLKKHRTFFKK